MSTDIVSILGNLSQSLYPVQNLITGFAYVLGIVFFYSALEKLKKMAEHHGQSSSGESIYVPIAYIIAGTMFIYLPTAIGSFANTAFGVGNVLTYPTVDKSNVFQTVGLLVRTAGLVWFIRGTALVAHSSEPGTKHGTKGLFFIIAGVLAINFDNSVAAFNSALLWFINLTMTFKAHQGY